MARSLFTLTALACMALQAQTTQAQGPASCFAYSDDAEVIVELENVTESNSTSAALEVFDAFIEHAKANDVDAIVSSHSQLDGSRQSMREELARLPDKFELYAGLASYQSVGAFKWGNYFLLLNKYAYGGQEITFANAVLCTNVCELSNIVERLPDEETELVVRFTYLTQRSQPDAVACPAADAMDTTLVAPKFELESASPLKLHTAKGLIAEPGRFGDPLAALTAESPKCSQLIGEFYNLVAEADRLPAVQRVLDACTVNTELGSQVPVAELEPPSSSYYDPNVLLGSVGQSAGVVELLRLRSGPWSVHGLRFQPLFGGPRLVALPLSGQGSDARFDWQFYSTGLGELLGSRVFAEHIQSLLGRDDAAQ